MPGRLRQFGRLTSKFAWLRQREAALICCVSTVMFLATTGHGGDKLPDQSCTGENKPAVIAASTNAGASNPGPGHTDHNKPHSIRLTWDPSVPAKADKVVGYYIYRRESAESCDQTGSNCQELNPITPIWETSCIDYRVRPGHTYIYQARAVSARGALSGFSNEAKATLPSK